MYFIGKKVRQKVTKIYADKKFQILCFLLLLLFHFPAGEVKNTGSEPPKKEEEKAEICKKNPLKSD